jgi:hypothetical protein
MTDVTPYQPPQAKKFKSFVNIALIGAAVFAGVTLFTRVAPTVNDALNLLQQMLSNSIYMLGTGAVLVGLIFLLYETFSSKGKIHGILSQMYNSAINKAAWALLDIDPISPLTDKIKEMTVKKATFDEAFAKFDGGIAHLLDQASRFRAMAKQAEQRAKAARSQNVDFSSYAYEAKRCGDAAEKFEGMAARLVPVRSQISQLQSATAQIISNLKVDINITKAEWAEQQNMSALDKSARGILGPSTNEDLADQAQQLIQQKYGEQIGRLTNLSELAKPLVDSMNLDKASASIALLDKWESETAKPIPQITNANLSSTAIPVTGFATLIK